MGEMPTLTLAKGEAIQIATGGVLPQGANAVVMVEHVEELKGELAVYSPVKQWENTVLQEEEITAGNVIAKRGDVVSPLMVGVLSSVGIEKVKVFDKIKVAIISTGDELVDVSEKAENGKIRDVNTSLLSALLSAGGYDVVWTTRIKDDEQLFRCWIFWCINPKSTALKTISKAGLFVASFKPANNKPLCVNSSKKPGSAAVNTNSKIK